MRVPRRPYDRWRDVDGVHIPDQSRVEQVAVEKRYGALPSRYHRHGEVIGRGIDRVNVVFDGESNVVSVRPYLLRVLARRWEQ